MIEQKEKLSFPWTTNPEVIRFLEDRWASQKDKLVHEDIDPPLLKTLRLFNRIPGLVTYMSCASHPTTDRTFVWTNDAKRRGASFYISFAADAEGANHLINIFDLLVITLNDLGSATTRDDPYCWFVKNDKKIALTFATNKMPQGFTHEDPNWKAMFLKAELNRHDPRVLEAFIFAIEGVLEHYIETNHLS